MSDKWEKVGDGKVATVVSETQIAINRGSEAGVSVDDRVIVHKGVTVTDPDTGEELGVVRVPRLSCEVVSVQEKLAVARVTDRVPSDQPFNVTRIPRMKTITTDLFEEDAATVLITLGMDVTILREKDRVDNEL